ncbi:microtubule associated protein-domain-containing protein, partial [Baffinella frigidus]
EDDLEDAEGVDAKIKADEAWKLTLANLSTLQCVDAKIKAEQAWKLTLANLSTLQGRIQALRDEKEARTLSRGALLNHMATLWERIKTPAEDRERFPLEHPGIAMRTLHTLEAEIARLQEVKIAMMKELVLDTRVSLTEVWTAMCMTDDATRNFSPAFTEVFTEEALHLHELHLAACKTKLEAMQPILKLVERREFIRTEEEAMKLEAMQPILELEGRELIRTEEETMKLAASDPNRLMGRGRGMAEQLKKEEKVRYMVQKEQPKLIEKLRPQLRGHRGVGVVAAVRYMVQKEQPKLIEKLRATIAEFESSRAEHLTLNGSLLVVKGVAELESSRAEHLALNGSRLLDTLPEEEVFKKPALPGSKPAVPSGFAAPKRTAEKEKARPPAVPSGIAAPKRTAEKEKARPSSATPVSRTKAAPDSENNRPQSARAAGKFRAAAKEIGRLPMASLNAADAPDQIIPVKTLLLLTLTPYNAP